MNKHMGDGYLTPEEFRNQFGSIFTGEDDPKENLRAELWADWTLNPAYPVNEAVAQGLLNC